MDVMNVEEFIGKVHIAYKGKGAQKAPLFGTPKANQYLSIANDKLRIWACDPKYLWNTLFSDEEASYNGNAIDVPDGFVKLADSIEIVNGVNKIILNVVTIEQRRDFKNCVYLAGFSPKKIHLTSEISSTFIGGKVLIPCGLLPPKLIRASQRIVVDNIDWLINATAAELARNDPAKDDQFGTLNGIANVEYRKMMSAATIILHNQPNYIPRRPTSFNMGGPA